MKELLGWAVAVWGVLVSGYPSARAWLVYLSIVLVGLNIALRIRELYRRWRD